jgi:hypothetical protein
MLPQRCNSGASEGGTGDDRRLPFCERRRQDVQRCAVFGSCHPGAGGVVAVRLVDCDHVGQFDQAFLEPLQLVAGAGQHQRKEKVRHIGNGSFRLADAHRLDQDHVVAGRLAQQQGLARSCSDAAEGAGGRRGPDVGVGVGGEPRHPGLVGEDRAAGPRRRWIDRQHCDLVAKPGQMAAERVDEH